MRPVRSPDLERGLVRAAGTSARLPSFKVALIDPSLFTLPYDLKLVEGLREIGHSVSFYGKTLGPDETAPEGAKLAQHLPPEMQSWGISALAGGHSRARPKARFTCVFDASPP